MGRIWNLEQREFIKLTEARPHLTLPPGGDGNLPASRFDFGNRLCFRGILFVADLRAAIDRQTKQRATTQPIFRNRDARWQVPLSWGPGGEG
jgi:hypothetical protein